MAALCDVAANPASSAVGVVNVTLEPGTNVHVDPSIEVYAVNVLPARVTFR